MDDHRKNHIDLEWSPQKDRSKQLQTHNVPACDVENTKAQIREKIYDSLISHGLLPKEQRGCRKWTRGTEELLYIDQYILSESNRDEKILPSRGLTANRHIIWFLKAG